MKVSAITAVVAVAAMGCGSGANPKNFLASVDLAPYVSLPATCYPTGAVLPTTSSSNSNDQLQFAVWTSADGKTTVLTIANFSSFFGVVTQATNNFRASLGDTFISTDGKTFTATDTSADPSTDNPALTDKATATITFTDTTYTKGTVDISAVRTCAGDACATDNANFSCDPGAASFIANQVQGNTVFYTGN
jgi:hypothetical protein